MTPRYVVKRVYGADQWRVVDWDLRLTMATCDDEARAHRVAQSLNDRPAITAGPSLEDTQRMARVDIQYRQCEARVQRDGL